MTRTEPRKRYASNDGPLLPGRTRTRRVDKYAIHEPKSNHWQNNRGRVTLLPKPNRQHKDTSRINQSKHLGNQTQLQRIQSLLDLIWHRNKNQFRTQPWWKWLSQLRKCIRELVDVELRMEDLEHSTQGSVTSSKGISEQATTAEEVRLRLAKERDLENKRDQWRAWTGDVVISEFYTSVSALVADVQFAALGLVLIGLVSEIAAVVGHPGPDAEDVRRRKEIKADSTAKSTPTRAHNSVRKDMSLTAENTSTRNLKEHIQHDSEVIDLDLGVVISRDSLVKLPDSKQDQKPSTMSTIAAKPAQSRPLSTIQYDPSPHDPTSTQRFCLPKPSAQPSFQRSLPRGSPSTHSARMETDPVQPPEPSNETPKFHTIRHPSTNPDHILPSEPRQQQEKNVSTPSSIPHYHVSTQSKKSQKDKYTTESKRKNEESQKKSKVKRKKNVIDDLFAGFG